MSTPVHDRPIHARGPRPDPSPHAGRWNLPVPPAHWSASSLPSQLNQEWQQLCQRSASADCVRGWATPVGRHRGLTQLAGCDGPDAVLHRLQRPGADPGDRDALLVGLLERAQDGDALAGRVVLQAMLPAAVRIARAISGRPDVLGDLDEAFALVLAALWQVIATYPVARRRRKIPANIYLDTLALVRRGDTSGSHRSALVFPEQAFADIRVAGEPGRLDVGSDDLAGPADAQVCTLLAWAVRCGHLHPQEAQLLVRVYGLDGSARDAGRSVAAELGISRAGLRQRCHRLARRVGRAALAAGFDGSTPTGGAVLCAA